MFLLGLRLFGVILLLPVCQIILVLFISPLDFILKFVLLGGGHLLPFLVNHFSLVLVSVTDLFIALAAEVQVAVGRFLGSSFLLLFVRHHSLFLAKINKFEL